MTGDIAVLYLGLNMALNTKKSNHKGATITAGDCNMSRLLFFFYSSSAYGEGIGMCQNILTGVLQNVGAVSWLAHYTSLSFRISFCFLLFLCRT